MASLSNYSSRSGDLSTQSVMALRFKVPSLTLIFELAITICLISGFTTSVLAKSDADPYPVIGAVSTSLAWNHSAFVPQEQSPASLEYNLPESQGFGWSLMRLNASLSYTWKFTPKLPPLFFSGQVGFERALTEGFGRAGVIPTATTQPKRFYAQDLSTSVGWTLPGVSKFIPKMIVNIGFNASLPLSLISQSQGIYSYLSSFLSVIYSTPFKLVIQGSGFVGYNVLDNPTRQIDCTVSPEACRISGADLGSPNDLMYWGGVLNFQYPLIGGLRLGATYRMFGSLGAATFPQTSTDPFASPHAQSGDQVGALIHGTTFSLLFGFNRTASAAQQALNESLGSEADEDRFLDRLSLGLSMTTNDRLYSSDGARITVPVFDFETANLSRTTYNLSALITL